ncbi:MAG TPA: metallophosphoesterase family protein [Usitatibacter sp.]|nr:metallophosphoesterase family protein [Usitatibacter sp.]
MRIDRALCALAFVFLAGCAAKPTHPDAFSFAVMGDTQYNAAEEAVFVEMLDRIGREDLAFVVHVGDIIGGVDCTDAIYARRKAEFDASAHPFIYTPGDNEWTDCHQARRGNRDPIERLAKIRGTFFADRFSLGRKRLELLVQGGCVDMQPEGCRCAGLPENRFWSRGGVRFVTLSVPGSENNRGRDAANDEEARCRDEANRAWLEQAVRLAERGETRGLVIFIHANPWDSKKGHYRALIRQVEVAARRVGHPVLFVHGDSHNQRIDAPFSENILVTRLETYGSPLMGWIKVTVDPDDPMVFRMEPKLYKVVKP